MERERQPSILSPAEIEQESMRIIRRELDSRGIRLREETESIVMRVLHATADFDFAENLVFTPGAVSAGVLALSSQIPLITDTNMAKAGISRPALQKLENEVYCYMAEERVRDAAREQGCTRAAAAMRLAASLHKDAVYAIGNAPTALWELGVLIREGLRPRLVIGVPVGFVNVVESKEEVLALCRENQIPGIFAMGRKGGSTAATAICNALLYEAAQMRDPRQRC